MSRSHQSCLNGDRDERSQNQRNPPPFDHRNRDFNYLI